MVGHPMRLTMLAGWLFADLFLVLLLTGLAALPAKPSGSGRPPTPTPTATHDIGLDPRPIDFNIEISPADFRGTAQNRFLARVNAELGRRNPSRRPVGFVLIFASGPQGDAGTAQETATRAISLLQRRSGPFADATGLGYWSGSGNHFEFKIFLLR